jgi:regulator of sigma D
MNQPCLRDLVLGQAKINENITKKLSCNDKMFENINSKFENLSSSVKNQLSFNKNDRNSNSSNSCCHTCQQHGDILGPTREFP